jgi:hypothetical protein
MQIPLHFYLSTQNGYLLSRGNHLRHANHVDRAGPGRPEIECMRSGRWHQQLSTATEIKDQLATAEADVGVEAQGADPIKESRAGTSKILWMI